MVSFEPVYLRCSKLVNPEAIHGALRSFLDLPGISGRILTSRNFRPCLDMCFCRFLICLDILAISRLTRTSLSFPGFLGHPCRFLAFWDIPAISWFSRTSLPFSGFLGHSCHFLAFSDISVVFWLSGTFLPFPGFLGHPCSFLAFSDIPAVSWLSRTSLPCRFLRTPHESGFKSHPEERT
ncbi:hypothetical protein Taro_027753 [Colocasia esculenta]|uniref:Uncharacterized protein n=1 Tax=Colocasia esculenta TaxID=4460 RepID=A0A843VNE3_COLES|nr:hypothetical protein [Colocasia esculenta]